MESTSIHICSQANELWLEPAWCLGFLLDIGIAKGGPVRFLSVNKYI